MVFSCMYEESSWWDWSSQNSLGKCTREYPSRDWGYEWAWDHLLICTMLEFKLKESLYLGSQLKFRRRVSLRSPKVATSSSSSVVANIRPPKQFLSSKYFSEKGKKVVQRFSNYHISYRRRGKKWFEWESLLLLLYEIWDLKKMSSSPRGRQRRMSR